MTSKRADWLRTHTCGELGPSHAGSEVVLNGWIENFRQPGRVLFGLTLYPGEGMTRSFGLENSDRLSVDEQEVVGEPMTLLEGELTNRHTLGSGEVHLGVILDYPAGCLELGVDSHSGELLRCVLLVRHPFLLQK